MVIGIWMCKSGAAMTEATTRNKKKPVVKATTELVYLERILLNQIHMMVLCDKPQFRGKTDDLISESEKTLRGEYDV